MGGEKIMQTMKWIVSAFTPSLHLNKSLTFDFDPLDEDEFRWLIQDAYSVVRHKDIAKILNVAHNEEYIKARPGDTIFIAYYVNQELHFGMYRIREADQPMTRLQAETITA